MALYDYNCESCGRPFEVRSVRGGAPPGGSHPCACGGVATRVWGAGLQVQVRGRPFDYTTVGAQPVDRRLEPGGRGARQVQRDSEKLIGAKARLARQAKRLRGTSRARWGMRHIGSIDQREINAIRAQTGNRQIVRDEGIENVLRRAGKHFDHL